MSARTVRGDGALINIADRGTGIPEEQLGQFNWQLAHPHLTDVTASPHLGLFAVAQLAARHGITVALALSPGGGTTAEVRLPAALISPDAKPSVWAGPADEALPGAEVPEAVPLTLSAPLPTLAPPATFAEAGPPAVDGEPSGPLPIFQSVESSYLHGRDPGGHGPAAPPSSPAAPPAPVAPATPATPAVGGLTSAGLPQRIPQGNPVPPARAAEPPARQAATADSAHIAISRLASFQRGSRRARAVTRTDREAMPSSQDD
jgi:hypothetical protein